MSIVSRHFFKHGAGTRNTNFKGLAGMAKIHVFRAFFLNWLLGSPL